MGVQSKKHMLMAVFYFRFDAVEISKETPVQGFVFLLLLLSVLLSLSLHFVDPSSYFWQWEFKMP